MGSSGLNLTDKLVLALFGLILACIAIPAAIFVAGAWKLDEVLQKRFGKNYER